jgi:dTMP kinase
MGHAVVATCEPGGTPAGAAIRGLLLGADRLPLSALAELFLYCADRMQHVCEVVRPGLDAGRIVLCDRFSDSTIAYQGFGRGLDLAVVRALDAQARDGVSPDLTFLLDCAVEEGLARAGRRGSASDRFEREACAFHERVRAGFLTLAREAPARFVVLDAHASFQALQQQVFDELQRRLVDR